MNQINNFTEGELEELRNHVAKTISTMKKGLIKKKV